MLRMWNSKGVDAAAVVLKLPPRTSLLHGSGVGKVECEQARGGKKQVGNRKREERKSKRERERERDREREKLSSDEEDDHCTAQRKRHHRQVHFFGFVFVLIVSPFSPIFCSSHDAIHAACTAWMYRAGISSAKNTCAWQLCICSVLEERRRGTKFSRFFFFLLLRKFLNFAGSSFFPHVARGTEVFS